MTWTNLATSAALISEQSRERVSHLVCSGTADLLTCASIEVTGRARFTRCGGQDTIELNQGGGGCLTLIHGGEARIASGDSAITLYPLSPGLAEAWTALSTDAGPLVGVFWQTFSQCSPRLADIVDAAVAEAVPPGVSVLGVRTTVDACVEFRASAASRVWEPEELGDQTCLRIVLTVDCTVMNGNRKEQTRAAACMVGGEDYERRARSAGCRAAEWAVEKLSADPIAPGVYDLVLAPAVGALLLHETCGHLLEQDQLLAAPLARSIGQRVGSKLLTVYDDATPATGFGSYAWDDEGQPGRRNPLIVDGTVCSLLTDIRSGLGLNLSPTGNGRRASVRDPVLARMSNTVVASGSQDGVTIMGEATGGLWIQETLGATVSRSCGSLTFRVGRGRRIESGQPGTPIRDIVVAGDSGSLVRSISAVGNDPEWAGAMCLKIGQAVPVGLCSPTLLIKDAWCVPVHHD